MLSILLLNVHQHAAIQANTEELTKELGIFLLLISNLCNAFIKAINSTDSVC